MDIKSSLAIILICFMSLPTVRVSIAKKMETIHCRFLWGDSNAKRKCYITLGQGYVDSRGSSSFWR